MIYACIGFAGVLIGALCVHFFAPQTVVYEEKPIFENADAADAQLAKQWQNLLNFTADAGGDGDDTDS